MKSYLFRTAVSMIPFALLCVCSSRAQESQFPALAKRVVNASVGVKPGDVVVVAGGSHTIPLMEEVAIEASMAGGMVQMLLNTDRLARAVNADVPKQYLKQQPKYLVDWIKDVDVWIAMPDLDDYPATVARRQSVCDSRALSTRCSIGWRSL